METYHTPGPWKKHIEFQRFVIRSTLHNYELCAVHTLSNVASPWIKLQQIANARLIERSPELLEALQAANALLNKVAALSRQKTLARECAMCCGYIEATIYPLTVKPEEVNNG